MRYVEILWEISNDRGCRTMAAHCTTRLPRAFKSRLLRHPFGTTYVESFFPVCFSQERGARVWLVPKEQVNKISVGLLRMDRDVRESHMHARLMCADDVCIYFSSGLCFSCCCRKNRVSRPSVNVVIEMDVSTICFKLLTVS